MKVELKEAQEALLQRRTSAPHQQFATLLTRSFNLRDRVFCGCNCPDYASSSSY